MKQDKIKVGITQGDINGIGYEVIIKTLMDIRMLDFCIPVVYGSPKVAAYHRKALNIENFSLNNIKSAKDANPKRANIINVLDDNVRVELGKSTQMAGEASLISLEMAVKDLKEEDIDVLITAPINKHNIRSEKFSFQGHTEYLESQFDNQKALMLMVSDILKVGVVTGHIPLEKVKEAMTLNEIMNKLRIMNRSLIYDFGIRKPRIAVLGLNPHAGDNGIIGNEEIEIIVPAIEKANEKNMMCFGPFPADGFFASGNFSRFDAVLAMYHDQGLIPFKTLAMDEGVNYTSGLSIVRTSPAHGTAYEIAGKGEASEASFRKALYTAIDIFRNRAQYDELNKDPLQANDLSKLDNQ